MVDVKKISKSRWKLYEDHPDVVLSPFYDPEQHGDKYEYYYISCLAYWDGFIVFDTVDNEAVAVYSMVATLGEATNYIREYRED